MLANNIYELLTTLYENYLFLLGRQFLETRTEENNFSSIDFGLFSNRLTVAVAPRIV